MAVVAEGIETADQLAQLLVLGCGFGQGFLLARPSRPDELERLLASRLVPRERHRQRCASGRSSPLSR